MPITTVRCPGCESLLKLANPVAAGQRIRCHHQRSNCRPYRSSSNTASAFCSPALATRNAVRAGKTGAILQRITDAGFKLRALKLIHMTKPEAEGFYAVHRGRPFFPELTSFMSSAPCVVMALEKENAVKAWRDLMGATDPAKADEGTLRKEFANSIGENAVHGSDSEENARVEISYFFSQLELV